MSVRDGSDAGAGEAGRPGAVSPNRRAVMFGGVVAGAAGAAGIAAGRSAQPGARPGTRPKARSKILLDAASSPIVEDDGSVTVLPGPSGSDDFMAINSAFGMLPTETLDGINYRVGRVNLGPYLYKGSTQINKPVATDLVGAGPGTVLQPQIDGFTTLSCHDTNTLPGSGWGSYRVAAGTIRDLIIDGQAAPTGASSKGLSIGDGWGHKVQRVRIQNFNGSAAIGLYLVNKNFWTEKGHFQCTLHNNTTAAQVDSNGGMQSFEFNDFDFDVFVFAGQDGVMFTNGAYLSKGDFRMVGNFLTGGQNTVAGTALTLTGTSGTGTGTFGSHISNSRVAIEVESDAGLAVLPRPVNFGPDPRNKLEACTGTLIFTDAWALSNIPSGRLSFGGVIIGDANLTATGANTAPPGWL